MNEDEAKPSASHVLRQAARLVGATVSEMVPPDTIAHLIRAQREFLLAATSVVEHNLSRTASARSKPRKRRKRPDPVDID